MLVKKKKPIKLKAGGFVLTAWTVDFKRCPNSLSRGGGGTHSKDLCPKECPVNAKGRAQ